MYKSSKIYSVVAVALGTLLFTGSALAQQIAPSPPLNQPSTGPQSVVGEIIVKLIAGSGELNESITDPLGLQGQAEEKSGGELIYRLAEPFLESLAPTDLEQTILDIVEQLNQRDDVEYAQPNWLYHPSQTLPNDAFYNFQWHYFNNGTAPSESPGGINLPNAWDNTTGSNAVVVAVLDTGIVAQHADISGSQNSVSGYDMISNTFIANDGGGRDPDPTDPGDATTANQCFAGSPQRSDSWHGTHVAGTVGIVDSNNATGVSGVAWKVGVQAVRVLGRCGGTTADISDGIRWAAGLSVPGVPLNQNPAQVINMSLGGSRPCSADPAYQSAINDAVNVGVTVVVSAGNDAIDAAGKSPASCNSVITVAASDFRGHLVSRYSNYGSTIEIMAPGGDLNRDDNGDGFGDGVLSTINNTYSFYNGTSMAAPHVAGVAALLLSQDSSLSPNQVLQHLQANAIPRNSTQCPDPCGAGLLNADINLTSDSIAPLANITNPGSNLQFLPASTRLGGTASDEGGSGFDSVVLALQDSAGRFLDWDTNKFTFGLKSTEANLKNTTDSSTRWDIVVTGLQAGTYRVNVSAIDGAGNQRRNANDNVIWTRRDFQVESRDSIAPLANITNPASNNVILPASTRLGGTASDEGGSGFDAVLIALQDVVTNRFLDWDTNQFTFGLKTTEANLKNTTVSSTRWDLVVTGLPPGTYRVNASAIDGAGNQRRNANDNVIWTRRDFVVVGSN